MKNKIVLVTGGDGFIGNNLVNELLNLNYNIIIVDNNVTSYPSHLNDSRVIHMKEDVKNLNLDLVPRISYIFHLASVASPLVYKNDFNNVYGPNVLGTEKMIHLAKRDNARLIYSSTSEVYGALNNSIIEDAFGIKENTIANIHLLTNRSIYPNSKRMGEELIYHYKNCGGDAIILRLFNVYGPNMDKKNNGYGRVIPNFINSIVNNNPIYIFGDGTQIRSFIWIEDLLEILIKIMNHPNKLPTVVNVGNDQPITINNLAEVLFDLFDKRTKIEYKEMDVDDPKWRRPDNSLVKLIFDWSPKTDLKSGLYKIINGDTNDLSN